MSRSRPRRANSSRAIAYDGSSATCRPTSRTSAGLLPSWMPSTPNSAYTPPPSRPRPLAFLDRAAGAQYSVVTHNNRPPNRRTFNGRFWGERSFRGAWSITFFRSLGEISRCRGLGQHASDDLIGQALKGLMNMSFQTSKLRRMVPQLGNPAFLLVLQLLLQLPQHFVNVRHHRPRGSFETHFHMPPAIHVGPTVCAKPILSTDVLMAPFRE